MLPRRTAVVPVLALVSVIGACEREQSGSEFARFVSLGDDEGSFETAIVDYRNGDGVVVSLIAAIHIADARHFEQLNQEFAKYDALLYELVAPETFRPKPGDSRSGGFNPIALLQNGLKNALQLSFQLDAIDYTPANFVHADLTPDGFATAMRENDESILTIMLDLMARQAQGTAAKRDEDDDDDKSAAEGSAGAAFDIVSAFRNREGRHALRMMFGRQLMAIESLAAGGEGSVLIEGRNDRALEVLSEQIGAGKRRLGIYYGAAHMYDIERKLFADGFEKVGQRWLEAWDIRKRLDPKPTAPPRVGAPR